MIRLPSGRRRTIDTPIGREKRAYHEAGHAAVAEALGLPVLRVSIEPGRSECEAEILTGAEWHRWRREAEENGGIFPREMCARLEAEICFAFGGAAAAQRKWNTFQPSAGDEAGIANVLQMIPGHVREQLREQERLHAIRIVNRRWNRVQSIAADLLQFTTITQLPPRW